MSRLERIVSKHNLFFILECELLYQEKGIETDEKLNSDHDLRLHLQYGNIACSFPPCPARYEGLKLPRFWYLKKTSNRRSKKGVDEGLSSLIASKWKNCDREVKVYVTAVARIVKNQRDKAIKNRRDAVRLIQNTQANPSFQANVKRKRKDEWADGFYGVQLENTPASALPYFQSYFQSRATPCHSALPYDQSSNTESMVAFAPGTRFKQQILPSTKAATTCAKPANESSDTTDKVTDKVSLNKKEATQTKAAYRKSFGSQPPNNRSIISDRSRMILSLPTSPNGHTPEKNYLDDCVEERGPLIPKGEELSKGQFKLNPKEAGCRLYHLGDSSQYPPFRSNING